MAENGVARITLCLMDMPSRRPEQLAVAELTESFREIFGAELTVLKNRLPAADVPALVLGDNKSAREAGIDPNSLPPEGFVIKTAPNRIFIVGNDDSTLNSHGTAWGVYEFLERILDVRWYWPEQQGGRTLSRRDAQNVAPMWIEDAPVYRKREIWPGNSPGLPELHTALRHGNSWPINLVVHAPHKWGPLFKADRPEIFELNKGGQRADIMLCYGNRRTLETYLEVIDKHMKGEDQPKEAAQIIQGNAVTVSPWDVGVNCQCEDCRRLWDADGGRYGTASPILEDFVRKLATEMKERWPELVVIYLPYLNYTLAASEEPFPDNVEVQLCGMPGVALYKEPAVWDKFQGNIDRWAALTARPVQTWDYSCWPTSSTRAPYQFPHTLKKYYTYNQDQIVGSFINGEGNHWPRLNFSLYCWMKLLWNPAFDVDAAADEACNRLFGAGAEPMRELWRLQATQWENSRFPGGVLTAGAVYDDAFPKSVIDRMKTLLANARELAKDDALVLKRIDYYTTPFPEFYKEYEYVVEGKGMTSLTLMKASEMPEIDGRLDEPAWQTAAPVDFKVYDSKEKTARDANFPTELRALWLPGQGLLFGFHMSEPNPGALQNEKQGKDDGGLWHQDCVEIFIDPTGRNTGKFHQFILTAGKAVFDAKEGDAAWDCEGLRFATHIGDDFWSLEVFIPAASLDVDFSSTAGGGRVWHGQFTRHRISDRTGGTENQKMNANQGGFNSNTGDFGELRFVE
ncbi:MAG: DUF4838 domain-containing protein [Kiritimatiellia bacterium]